MTLVLILTQSPPFLTTLHLPHILGRMLQCRLDVTMLLMTVFYQQNKISEAIPKPVANAVPKPAPKGTPARGTIVVPDFACACASGGVFWHKASVSDCLPLAAPIGLSRLLILTLCGHERVLVVSTEPLDDLPCLTTPRVGCCPCR